MPPKSDTGDDDIGEHTGSLQGRNRPGVVARNNAYYALRDRLRPHITIREVLEDYLEHNSWDIDRAYAQYTTHTLQLQQGAPPSNITHDDEESDEEGDMSSNSEDDSSEDKKEQREEELFNRLQNSNLPYNPNTEMERRDAALAFREQILEKSGVRLSISEAVLLLELADWDLGEAMVDFQSYEEALNCLHKEFEQHRSQIDPEDIEIGPVQEAADRRLATLITVTARPDWWSLLKFLEKHKFQLIKAVVAWFKNGIPRVPHKKDKDGFGRRVDYNKRPLPMPTAADTRPAAHAGGSGWATEPKAYKTNGSSSDPKPNVSSHRAHGTVINGSRRTAKVGQPDPQKFLIEYISKGRYWANRFNKKGLIFREMVGDAVTAKFLRDGAGVEFNWHNQNHIEALNSWCRQNYSRITGEKIRAAAQEWSQEELDFLYSLFDSHLKDLKRQRPDAEEPDLLPMTLSEATKKKWVREFNEKFVGTMQPGAKAPRVPRKIGAMITMAKRHKPIPDRFKLKPDQNWIDQQELKAKRKGGSGFLPEIHPGGTVEPFTGEGRQLEETEERPAKRHDDKLTPPKAETDQAKQSLDDMEVKEEVFPEDDQPPLEEEELEHPKGGIRNPFDD